MVAITPITIVPRLPAELTAGATVLEVTQAAGDDMGFKMLHGSLFKVPPLAIQAALLAKGLEIQHGSVVSHIYVFATF